MSSTSVEHERLVTLTAEIVSAYVGNNHLQSGELARLLSDVHRSVTTLVPPLPAVEPPKATAQEIKRSITHEHLISFEDGKPYKTLRRHLTLRGLSPDQYRRKWGLDSDYPMTAAGYSEQRSALAKTLGLGQPRPVSVVAQATAEEAESAPKRRGSRNKAP